MDVSFLKDIKLEPVSKAAPKTRVSVATLPEVGDLRVFKNGKVYPSEAFATEFNLEFQPKVNIASEGEEPVFDVVGNGLDIFSSTNWGMIKGKLPQEVMFLAAVPKTDAKVDMWASTKYDDDNNPKASVFTQGANTFSKDRLLPMLTEIYGIDWDKVDYVDMEVVRDTPIVSESGIYLLPKVVSTGSKKGEATYIRRENLTVCPLVIASTKFSEEPAIADKDVISEVKAKDPIADVKGTIDPGDDWATKLGSKKDKATA
jgi:hypothetical protein